MSCTDFPAHEHKCGGGRCGQCFISRNWPDLKQQFPWLEFQLEPFGVGCSVCRMAGREKKACHGGSWGSTGVTGYSSLQIRAFQKHEDSLAHHHAAGEHVPEPLEFPSKKDFQSLLKHMKKNPVGQDGLAGVAGHKKCRKMVWCLAEANRERKRDLFRPGVGVDGNEVLISTTLFQDARKGKLSVRCRSASTRLVRFSAHIGTVDLCKEFSLDSIGVMQGTLFALSEFCIRWMSPPYVDDISKVPEPHLDQQLLDQLLNSVETFVSDSASDELRAGQMLAGQSTTTQYLPRLPNLKVVVRDRPHATRRNVSRGWKADGVLHDILTRFVLGESSPVRLIQYSQQFKQWFAAHIRHLEPGLSAVKAHDFLKDLGFAAHRFDSIQKPMSRIVLFLHPFLATIVQIATERRGKTEGAAALDFLTWVSTEKLVLFAMMTDGGEENLHLTRIVDYEGFPLEELPSNILAFKDRLRKLFTGDRPLCLCTGFTGHMLGLMRHEYCINLPGLCKQLGKKGGVGDEVLVAALHRMSSWVALTESTLDAEFPAFEIQTAFSIFSVNGDAEPSATQIRTTKMLSRLQQAFGCEDLPLANKQLERLRFVAVRLANQESLGSCEAWLQAIKTVTRTWQKGDFKALLPILVRYWASGASTSAVEQSFSRGQKSLESLQVDGHLNDAMEACISQSEDIIILWFQVFFK